MWTSQRGVRHQAGHGTPVWRVHLGGGSLRAGPQAPSVGSRSRACSSGSSESITIPMIPLGLKETTELDWATPLKVSAGL